MTFERLIWMPFSCAAFMAIERTTQSCFDYEMRTWHLNWTPSNIYEEIICSKYRPLEYDAIWLVNLSNATNGVVRVATISLLTLYIWCWIRDVRITFGYFIASIILNLSFSFCFDWRIVFIKKWSIQMPSRRFEALCFREQDTLYHFRIIITSVHRRPRQLSFHHISNEWFIIGTKGGK